MLEPHWLHPVFVFKLPVHAVECLCVCLFLSVVPDTKAYLLGSVFDLFNFTHSAVFFVLVQVK